jgi:hypothetical protein
MTLFGIGDKFSFERRSWIVKDIINQNWVCETTDNGKKPMMERRFTKNEIISFISHYTEFTEQINLSDNSNSKNPYTNETVCIAGENYKKQDIFNALNKTGITKIEQTIENYIK